VPGSLPRGSRPCRGEARGPGHDARRGRGVRHARHRPVTSPELTVGQGVVDEMVRLAALGIPGVARVSRGGPAWRALLAGRPIVTQRSDDGVRVRVWI